MNESENPAPRGPRHPAPSSWRPRAEAREARGSSEVRQPRLALPPRLVSPAPCRLTFPGPPLPLHAPLSGRLRRPRGGLAPVAATASTERLRTERSRGRRFPVRAAGVRRARRASGRGGGAGRGRERGPPGSRGGAPPPQAGGGGGARRRRSPGSEQGGEGQARRGLAGRSVGPSLIPSPPLATGGGRAGSALGSCAGSGVPRPLPLRALGARAVSPSSPQEDL